MFKLILIVIMPLVSCYFYSNNPWYYNLEIPGRYSSKEVHKSSQVQQGNFINEWTVEIEGGEEIAELVALELGYVYGGELGEGRYRLGSSTINVLRFDYGKLLQYHKPQGTHVLGFPGTYIFYKYEHSIQRRNPSIHHTDTLNNDRRVRWAVQLSSMTRVKRYPVNEDPDKLLNRVKRINDDADNTTADVTRTKRETEKDIWFNDELWSDEWYLQDTRTRPDLPRLDLNVLPVYEMGVNGSGVRVVVLDDGLEHNHTDLRDNYDPEISWDCNDRDPDPMPRFDKKRTNSHGTRCAGEIAMVANNKKCGVGVAFGAKIGGVRFLDGQVTDRIEGEAIGYAWDKVDIYSASWGPDDNGRIVEGPGKLASKAFQRGITKGRDGKGSIYVWANGNGGGNRDNCNCDGYASSIYTISIASASQHGYFPWYGEICSSTLATTYSSGAYKEQKIATTDLGDTCTLRHTGTSAAAPLAAGIIALALSANPSLTWRDVQHLIVWTSDHVPLTNNPGWQINGAGFKFDIRFGFGLLNAGSLVKSAMNWTNVPEKSICNIGPLRLKERQEISSRKKIEIPFQVTCNVNFIEHVEVILSLSYTRRGALEIWLTSSSGTKIPLLSKRPNDKSDAGFFEWALTSVAMWGEHSKGIWIVEIIDESDEENQGRIESMKLVIHGTSEMPNHMKNRPSIDDIDDIDTKFQLPIANEIVDGIGTESPGSHEYDEVVMKYPFVFDDDQNELLRVHHRNPIHFY